MNSARPFILDNGPRGPDSQGGQASWYTPGLTDGLGDRLLMFDNTTASSLELLRFKREFGDTAVFEAALRRRIEELEGFSHPSLASVRAVQRLGDGDGLALISNHTAGRRLSEIFREAHGLTHALELVRQLTPVLATLQQQGDDIAHGALTAERIVVTPEGRLVILEYVLGSALESLRLPASRLRSELGLAIAPGSDHAVLDRRSDVIQLAFVALSVLLGRRVDPADYPKKSENLLAEFARTGPLGPASPHLRQWLEQALQLSEPAFSSAQDACDALTELPEDYEPEPAESHRRLRAFNAAAKPAAASSTQPTPEVDSLDNDEDEKEAIQDVAVAPLERSERFDRPSSSISARAGGDKPVTRRGAAMFEYWQAKRMTFFSRKVESPHALPRPAAAAVSRAAVERPPDASFLPQQDFQRRSVSAVQWAVTGLAGLALAEAIVIGGLINARRLRPAPVPGRPTAATTAVMIESPQPGAEVMVDGRRAGLTPLKVDVGSETHSIRVRPPELTVDNATRVLSPPAAPPTRLEISSDSPGARITVDGTPRGMTPLMMPVNPGPHTIVVSDGSATASRSVNVAAGTTMTVMAALGPAGAAAGWLSITVPLELQVLEGGSLVGTTSAARIMLPAGHHDLELANTAVGFRVTLPVDVQPGKTVTTTVTVPNGSLSINALPWANVFLDGRPLGTTPVANLEVPLGTHEVIWRHPQLGERRQTVVVTTKAPVRLQMDLSK